MDPFAVLVVVGILSGEYVIVIVGVIVFLLARRRARRGAADGGTQPIFRRGVLIAVGVLGFAANLLFLLPLTPLPMDLPEDVPYARGPLEVLPAWAEYALVPAVGAITQLIFVLAAARWVRRSRGLARGLDPRPRRWWSFLPRGTMAAGVTLVVLTCLTVVAAGVAATTDSRGRSTLIQITTPGGYGATLFPGWYYTVPVIAGTIVLVIFAGAALALIARPPSVNDQTDSDRRRAASHVGLAALAFLAMTLGRLWIFAALGGVGMAEVTTDEGSAWIVTSFQALTPVLGLAGASLVGAGLAACALLIVPARARSKPPVEAGTP